MATDFKYGTDILIWEDVLKLLENKKEIIKSEKSTTACFKIQKAFQNSYKVVSAWDNRELVGICRALSDGVKQSVIYDLNVSEEHQNKGIGQNLIEKLIAELPIGPIILLAIPGKEKYYQRFGFKKLLTGMALFPDQKKRISQGFIKNK